MTKNCKLGFVLQSGSLAYNPWVRMDTASYVIFPVLFSKREKLIGMIPYVSINTMSNKLDLHMVEGLLCFIPLVKTCVCKESSTK